MLALATRMMASAASCRPSPNGFGDAVSTASRGERGVELDLAAGEIGAEPPQHDVGVRIGGLWLPLP